MTNSLCSSETCLHLSYQAITAVIRCFPHGPTLRIKYFHFDQRRFINLNFRRIRFTDSDGATVVKLQGVLRRTGKYVFDVVSTKTVIAVEGISIALMYYHRLILSYFVIFSVSFIDTTIALPNLITGNDTNLVLLSASQRAELRGQVLPGW